MRVKISQFVHYRLLRERGSDLLPALREIRIPSGTSLIDLPSIFVTLSDNIKYVEDNSINDAIPNTEFTQPFLSLLGQKSPGIHHLVLRGGRFIDPNYILLFKSLHRLELRLANTFLSSKFIEELGNLGDLVGLVLHVGPPIPPSTPPNVLRPQPLPKMSRSLHKFCYLKDLELIGAITAISRFLEFTYLRKLVSLTIREEQESRNIQTESFWVDSFSKLEVSSFIQSVEIQQTAQRSWGHPGYSLSITSISPLLHLRTLKDLKIEGGAFCATDTGIFNISNSLPDLTRLSLPPDWYTSCPTIMALVHISLHSQQLNELKIPLSGDMQNSCSVISDSIDRLAREHCHALRHLGLATRFGQLTPKQMVAFAQFLHRSFPLLRKLEGYGANSASESWVQVHEIQLALQAEAKFQNAKN